MAINFSENIRSKKPFSRMAFLFSVLLLSNGALAQSSSDYLRTKTTQKGKLHFIEPIEFKSSEGNDLIMDFAITQVGKSIDTTIVNFTFTTRKHAPRIDSIQISTGNSLLILGTVENYYRGVKQQNHSFFCGFAPRDNPKIAIMCVVENSGRFGGTYAAPIVGLMIEKYLKDSITDKKRLERVEQLANLNLIPDRIYLKP